MAPSRSFQQRGAGAALLLVLLMAFAGCVDDSDDGTGPGPGPSGPPLDGTDGTGTVVTAPTWSIRDYWTYKPTQGDPATLVVTGDAGADWIIGTDSEDVSFFHAREEVSNLGAQRKSDLAGSQGSDRVVYFQWPLTDGARWNTTWDGVQREITTIAEEDGTWRFEAKEEDKVAVRYSYDPEVRWFKTLEFLGDDGTVQFGWTLEESGSDWTGEVLQWELETVMSFAEANADTYNAPPKQFAVGEEITDLWLGLHIECTVGTVTIGVHPLDDPAGGRRWNEVCLKPVTFEGSITPKVGQWNADFTWRDTTPGEVRYDLYLRTLERVAIG